METVSGYLGWCGVLGWVVVVPLVPVRVEGWSTILALVPLISAGASCVLSRSVWF